VLKRIYRIFGYSFVNVFVRLQTNIHLISTNNHCHHSRDLCMRRVVVRSVSIRVDLDHRCGSIFEGINAVLSPFCATKLLSTMVGQQSTTVGLQHLYRSTTLIHRM